MSFFTKTFLSLYTLNHTVLPIHEKSGHSLNERNPLFPAVVLQSAYRFFGVSLQTRNPYGFATAVHLSIRGVAGLRVTGDLEMEHGQFSCFR